MAKMLGFGRPTCTVMQTCYVVPDLAKAIDYHVRTLNVGPFFVLPHRTAPDTTRSPDRPRADRGIAAAMGERAESANAHCCHGRHPRQPSGAARRA